MRLLWVRRLYGEAEILYDTPWTRFTTDRFMRLSLQDVPDATLRIKRFDPDKKGIEEINVWFNATIDHNSMGILRCIVNTERNLGTYKDIYVHLDLICEHYVYDGIVKYSCSPKLYGWLRGGIFTSIYVNDTRRGHTFIIQPGYVDIEYMQGSILSCYLGPGGPIITVTSENPYKGQNELQISINSKYFITKKFNLI
ncbi:b136 [Murid betaherpesvirus 8]|uniref:B136 n=1 Tax=Rat cytomegalovirus (isolate England) TaxID=1261657 RepID=A0A0E3SWV9_RCMVE|nr:b136 [Murid betaherpesvirus 8]WPH25033.1 b136 [Murid betaherpesvirus 8]WPH25167.1 b136 [Murid betaherpesvirus 8]